MSKRDKRSLVIGIILILAGAFIIAERYIDFYYRYYLGWDVVLPALGALLGAYILVKAFIGPNRGNVFMGTIFLSLGVYFFLRNTYIIRILNWYESWPVIIIAVGLGFLMMFIVKPKDWGPIIPAFILLVLGGGFLAEEWGFIGGFLVLAVFFVMMMRGIRIVSSARDAYPALIGAGILTMIMFHVVVNVGMAMGIMPVTGIPLMLVSRGGSALWTASIGVGVLLNIYMRRYRY